MRMMTIIAALALTGFFPAAALGQDSGLTEIWVAEHAQVVERLVRTWLTDPLDPDLDRDLVRLLQLETYLEVSRADSRLYLPRLRPEVPLPPQLLVLYLEERDVQLRPRDLLIDREFRITVVK